MSRFGEWRAETFGGVLCIPLLAIGMFAFIDALGGLIIFAEWLFNKLFS